MREWSVACQRQATGLTIVQVPSTEPIPMMDANGKPILDEYGQTKNTSALAQALDQLKDLANGSIVGTDKNNTITTIPQTGGEGFLI